MLSNIRFSLLPVKHGFLKSKQGRHGKKQLKAEMSQDSNNELIVSQMRNFSEVSQCFAGKYFCAQYSKLQEKFKLNRWTY